MIDKCFMGYSKEFIDYITSSKDGYYIDQETFESLLPSKELIEEDEKQFKELYRPYAFMETWIEYREDEYSGTILFYPLSYYLTDHLLSYGISGKDRDDSKLIYTICRIVKKDEIEREPVEATFGREDLIQSTKMYQKKLIRKK